MDSFEDLEDLSRLGQVDDALHRYMTEAEQLTTSADPRLSRGMEFAPFASSLGNFDLQPTSSQPASTEHTQSSSGDSRNLVKGPQASSKSQRRPKGRPPETDNKAMGPWVVSNRRVQKRYRERQKAEKESNEQQLENLTAQLDSMKAKTFELAGHNSTLEKAVAFKDIEVANLQECSHAMDTASFPAAAATSTKHDADGMSAKTAAHPNVIQAYKCIVKTMIGLMLRLSTEGPTQPVVQGLEAAASSLIVLFMQTFIFSAHDAARLMKANLEHDHYQAGSVSSSLEDSKQLWQAVTDKLELRPEQRQEMANLREHFLQALAECHEAREAICLGLQKGAQKIQTAYSTIGTDSQAYVASMLEVHHETRQLRENLRKQHRVWMDFYATIFRLWDARQNCCAAVHSFPRFPDLLAISSCVAIMDGHAQQSGDKAFRTHKVEMKRSPRFTHRLLADS